MSRENVHDKDLRAFDNFLDFEEINEVFGENEKTKELFIWLDSNKLGVARSVFDVAEPALINAKNFGFAAITSMGTLLLQKIWNRIGVICNLPKNQDLEKGCKNMPRRILS